MIFTDNGSGMTDDVLQRIGEPFHTTKPDGNGLGIMIVHRIMETIMAGLSSGARKSEGHRSK